MVIVSERRYSWASQATFPSCLIADSRSSFMTVIGLLFSFKENTPKKGKSLHLWDFNPFIFRGPNLTLTRSANGPVSAQLLIFRIIRLHHSLLSAVVFHLLFVRLQVQFSHHIVELFCIILVCRNPRMVCDSKNR
eukprot:UN09510